MALFIYNLSIFFYRVGIMLAAPFNEKAQAFLKGRKNWRKKLKAALKDNTQPIGWFHCASVGEFEQARPIIETFTQEFPTYKILLTFFSPSGYELRKNYKGADYVFYLPLDTRSNARSFIKITQPAIAFFVKYEFWHHYIKTLADKKIPLLSVSTIFRPNQLFFKWFGGFYMKILRRINYFFLQDVRSQDILKSQGIENSIVAGDTRFDRVYEICNQKKELPLVEKFKHGHSLMVIGSCWPEDLSILTTFINDSTLKIIIAPHEINEKFMAQMQRDFIRKTIRYSQLTEDNAYDYDILIIDNIGMLSSLYRLGNYAYVGGAFGKGLHNILEPATFGIPIFFGNKNYEKFKEAIDLVNLGGAVALGSYDELRVQYNAFSDAHTYEIASQINADYVKNNTGATAKVINYCKQKLNK